MKIRRTRRDGAKRPVIVWKNDRGYSPCPRLTRLELGADVCDRISCDGDVHFDHLLKCVLGRRMLVGTPKVNAVKVNWTEHSE